jgi:hypothetical protein
MSSAEDPSEQVRRDMLAALEEGKWEFTKRALREGLDAFRRHSEHPSDEELIDYITDLLEGGCALEWTELTEPPFPGAEPPFGEAYEIKNADGQGLYIKLKYDWPYVIVMSFHY